MKTASTLWLIFLGMSVLLGDFLIAPGESHGAVTRPVRHGSHLYSLDRANVTLGSVLRDWEPMRNVEVRGEIGYLSRKISFSFKDLNLIQAVSEILEPFNYIVLGSKESRMQILLLGVKDSALEYMVRPTSDPRPNLTPVSNKKRKTLNADIRPEQSLIAGMLRNDGETRIPIRGLQLNP